MPDEVETIVSGYIVQSPLLILPFPSFVLLNFTMSNFLQNPCDSAYAYDFYSSLVVRMIEEGAKIKWVGWNTPKGTLYYN